MKQTLNFLEALSPVTSGVKLTVFYFECSAIGEECYIRTSSFSPFYKNITAAVSYGGASVIEWTLLIRDLENLP